jgi:hypothetical protein
MRSTIPWATLALAAGTALLPACGGSTFTPAMQPADVCALLTQADAQRLLPTAAAGTPQQNAMTDAYWSLECVWPDSATPSAKIVALILEGALTSEGAGALDVALTAPSGDGQPMAVSGLGDKASYTDNPGTTQLLGARVGNYLVNVTAYSLTPDVTEAQLFPLVANAIGGL